jgi:hypothetical protein
MGHRLKTPFGKAFRALGKCVAEPVFGIIKESVGFRGFSFRGLERWSRSGPWRCAAAT